MENNEPNLKQLTDVINTINPACKIKGFTNGNEALAWCNENAFLVDLFIGNWWGIDEEYDSPEGANVFQLVKWYKKPKEILIADETMFEKWSYKDGAIGFIQRPVTGEKMREIWERM